jgi:hypothetical protein
MRLSRTAAFYLQLSLVVGFVASSSAPTPLYAVYQHAWGFSPITITVIFGVYALAVLASLLVAGSLSDYVGRRPVLLAATLAQAAVMVVFATASGVGGLLVARVLQGLTTGAAAGAAGAGMLDIDRPKGTVANAVAPMLGTAAGSLLSGLAVAYLPAPTALVYLVLGAVFVVQAVGVAHMPETASPRPGALASLRLHLHVPASVRGPLLRAAPALVAAWALAGFYGSIGPLVVHRLAGSPAIALGGLALGALAAGGALAALLTQQLRAHALLRLGTAALAGGVALTLLAIDAGSLIAFFTGAAIAGAGFGASFQGGIRSVVPLAAAHERSGVLSIVYLIAYLAMGGPAVLGGVRVVHGGGVFATAYEYGVGVMLLSALAFAGTFVRARVAAARAAHA